jgi:hypothetical protein
MYFQTVCGSRSARPVPRRRNISAWEGTCRRASAGTSLDGELERGMKIEQVN